MAHKLQKRVPLESTLRGETCDTKRAAPKPLCAHQDINATDGVVDALSLAYADEDRQYKADGTVATMSLQVQVTSEAERRGSCVD